MLQILNEIFLKIFKDFDFVSLSLLVLMILSFSLGVILSKRQVSNVKLDLIPAIIWMVPSTFLLGLLLCASIYLKELAMPGDGYRLEYYDAVAIGAHNMALFLFWDISLTTFQFFLAMVVYFYWRTANAKCIS